MLARMTRPSIYLSIAAVLACLAIAFVAWVATGRPISWGVGIVLDDSCKAAAKHYVCQVELVPDGTHVAAQSSAPIVGGRWVKLRAWRLTGEASYTIVDDASGAVRGSR